MIIIFWVENRLLRGNFGKKVFIGNWGSKKVIIFIIDIIKLDIKDYY